MKKPYFNSFEIKKYVENPDLAKFLQIYFKIKELPLVDRVIEIDSSELSKHVVQFDYYSKKVFDASKVPLSFYNFKKFIRRGKLRIQDGYPPIDNYHLIGSYTSEDEKELY